MRLRTSAVQEDEDRYAEDLRRPEPRPRYERHHSSGDGERQISSIGRELAMINGTSTAEEI